MLIANLIYCKIIKKESKEEIDSLTTKEYKKFESKMKNHPSILRINYAYSLLVENNLSKANTYIEKFNKISKTHPYQSEIISERELIEIAQKMKNKDYTLDEIIEFTGLSEEEVKKL